MNNYTNRLQREPMTKDECEYAKYRDNYEYNDKNSPHYRDNERFSWAIKTINERFAEENSQQGLSTLPATQGEDVEVRQNLIEQLGRLFMVLTSTGKVDMTLPYIANAQEAFEVFRACSGSKAKKVEGEDVRKEAGVIAQWVIDNRYSKPGEQRMTDTEMWHILKDKIIALSTLPSTTENKEALKPILRDYLNDKNEFVIPMKLLSDFLEEVYVETEWYPDYIAKGPGTESQQTRKDFRSGWIMRSLCQNKPSSIDKEKETEFKPQAVPGCACEACRKILSEEKDNTVTEGKE